MGYVVDLQFGQSGDFNKSFCILTLFYYKFSIQYGIIEQVVFLSGVIIVLGIFVLLFVVFEGEASVQSWSQRVVSICCVDSIYCIVILLL